MPKPCRKMVTFLRLLVYALIASFSTAVSKPKKFFTSSLASCSNTVHPGFSLCTCKKIRDPHKSEKVDNSYLDICIFNNTRSTITHIWLGKSFRVQTNKRNTILVGQVWMLGQTEKGKSIERHGKRIWHKGFRSHNGFFLLFQWIQQQFIYVKQGWRGDRPSLKCNRTTTLEYCNLHCNNNAPWSQLCLRNCHSRLRSWAFYLVDSDCFFEWNTRSQHQRSKNTIQSIICFWEQEF